MAKKTVKAVTRKQKYLAAIAGDGTAPSPITSDEKLMYNIAEKVNEGGGSGGDNPFVVTLTPTSESGGTMDKSNVEILDAYTAGKTIMFDIALGDISVQVQATIGAYFDGITYPSFNALGVNTDHQLIHLYVDPRNSESDTFTMQVEDLGGGGLPEGAKPVYYINALGMADISYEDIVSACFDGDTQICEMFTSYDNFMSAKYCPGVYRVIREKTYNGSVYVYRLAAKVFEYRADGIYLLNCTNDENGQKSTSGQRIISFSSST